MEYTLYDNNFTKDNPDDRLAKAVNVPVKNLKDLLKAITGPGSILKMTESQAVIAAYWGAIINYVSNGNAYRDEYISIRLDITGVFDNDADRFDKARHALSLSIIPGSQLKDATQLIPLHFVKAEPEMPFIKTVYDWESETANQNLTSNGILEIQGDALKIYTEVEGQGVFFINKANGNETVANLPRINSPKTLTLRIPELVAGEYRLEVRNTARKCKTMRIGMSPINFTVT